MVIDFSSLGKMGVMGDRKQLLQELSQAPDDLVQTRVSLGEGNSDKSSPSEVCRNFK